MIKIENLYKTFFSELGTEKEVFKNLNLEINDGRKINFTECFKWTDNA